MLNRLFDAMPAHHADSLSPSALPAARAWPRLRPSAATTKMVAIVAALLFARVLAGFIAEPRPENLTAFFQVCAMVAPILLAIQLTGRHGPPRGGRRAVALAAAIVVSSAIGLLLRVVIGNAWDAFEALARTTWPRYALVGAGLALALVFYRHEIASLDAQRQAEVDRARFASELAESRLQVLQAQIEPHFLFNTLANVRRLHGTEPAAARSMLEHLTRYLQAALPQMRDGRSTLGREAEIALAYLRIQQMRMGRRLVVAIDIPAELHECPVPPMMLLTLAENAIKHGVGPARHGGTVRLGAHAEGGRLIVTVADSGVGLAPGSGAGVGLANIRARLAAQFGRTAQLALQNNELGGLTATIALPLAQARQTA
jgi:signal transduction histidine kinase